ncbi:MAG: phosphoribosylamine--glycine ligase [Verrucomicrobiota bacterium]|nr:phosphoribosylamine--glycine ligase [Verrucomicrobiota bacterium]
MRADVAPLTVKVLVVGGGGREHALAWKLAQSSVVERVFCAPGNAGTESVGENVSIAATDLSALLAFAKQNEIELTVVGPDDALAAGIADLFESEGLRVFGPTKSAARLESSKIFAKELMRHRGIPTAAAGTFVDAGAARKFCERATFPVVIKADGLALGKGVIIAQTFDQAAEAIDEMMTHGRFREAGRRIVIEEFLRGRECSLHALISGSSYRMLASARDHKRAFDGDAGPNTGGMGAVSPAEDWTAEKQTDFEGRVLDPLLSELHARGIAFRGLLFPGLMLTDDGAQVLEFNCRFGDPETQVILPRLKSDLVELLDATIEGNLSNVKIEWDSRTAVTVVLASQGYPEKYQTGRKISGLRSAAALKDVHIFHAGTRRDGDDVVTAGGRVVAVTALGATVAEAREQAYAAVSQIEFEGCQFRRDIALP